MGGYASCGRTNDQLVSNMCAEGLINSDQIENIFRAVDRGHFFLEDNTENAYNDAAWKKDNFHISAPCIYSEAMKAFDITRGKSFLNIGSGTGYLSTMVGLLLGVNGINHGIELYNEVVEHANMKVAQFKQNAPHYDWYDFCEPQFVIGNCLQLTNPDNLKYDLVYCGAECPEEHIEFVKNLLNIDGILVIPTRDMLKKIVRLSDDKFEETNLLDVNFATLVTIGGSDTSNIKQVALPTREPASLQSLCRSYIRSIIRSKHLKPIEAMKKKEPTQQNEMVFFGRRETFYLRHMIEPNRRRRFDVLFDDSSSDDDDSDDDDDMEIIVGDVLNDVMNDDDNNEDDDESDDDDDLPPLEEFDDDEESVEDDEGGRWQDVNEISRALAACADLPSSSAAAPSSSAATPSSSAVAPSSSRSVAAPSLSRPAAAPSSSRSAAAPCSSKSAGCSSGASSSKNPRVTRSQKLLERKSAKRRKYTGGEGVNRRLYDLPSSSSSSDNSDDDEDLPLAERFRKNAHDHKEQRREFEVESSSSSSSSDDDDSSTCSRPHSPLLADHEHEVPPQVDPSQFYQAINQLPLPHLIRDYLSFGRSSSS